MHKVDYSPNEKLGKKIYGVYAAKPNFDVTGGYTEYIHDLIQRCFIQNFIPASVLDDEDFCQMIAGVFFCPWPELLVPLSAKRMRICTKEAHLKIKNSIMELLQKQESLSFTLDMWTSPNSYGFLGVVVHYIDKNWEPKKLVIGMEHIEGSHTAKVLAQNFIKILDDFKISNKRITITTDSCSTMGLMGKELTAISKKRNDFSFDHTKQHIFCFAHILNLVCQSAISEGLKAEAWKVANDGVTVISRTPHKEEEPINSLLYKIRKAIVGIR